MKKFFLMFVGLLALSLCVACGSKKSSDDDDDDEDDDDKTEIVDKEKTSDKEVNEKKAAANTDADTSATRQDVDSIVCNKVGEMEAMKEA